MTFIPIPSPSMQDLRKQIADVTVAYNAYVHVANGRIGKLLETITTLQTEVERLQMDLADALDLKVGHGPTALASAMAEVENLRAVLTDINDRVTIWEIEKTFIQTFAVKTERLRWRFLGYLAHKALQREQS